MSKSAAADLVAKLTPQTDELRNVPTTHIAVAVESIGYAMDQLTNGVHTRETAYCELCRGPVTLAPSKVPSPNGPPR